MNLVYNLEDLIVFLSNCLENVGVGIIVVGIFMHLLAYTYKFLMFKKNSFKELKNNIGKVILLGLEILVAVDIVSTVTSKLTFESVMTLGLIVIIRTFLSLSIKVEMEGKFPWKSKA
ncbi:MAG: DUF1622 domain-containing protein [Rickettsiales bacterium]